MGIRGLKKNLKKKKEAWVSSVTLAFAEEIFCLITWPPYTLKNFFNTLHLFEHIHKVLSLQPSVAYAS